MILNPKVNDSGNYMIRVIIMRGVDIEDEMDMWTKESIFISNNKF